MTRTENVKKSSAGHRKRLKERFKRAALEGFHDYEIIELLLTFAIPRRDVKPVAKELIRRFGGLKGVFEAPAGELGSIKGIGESAALLLTLLKGMAEAYIKERVDDKNFINSPDDALTFLGTVTKGSSFESFLAVYLNSKNEILGVETLHEGPLGKMAISPRSVIEKAFKHNARSIIFAHNLPKREVLPTDAERRLARDLVEAAYAIDIIVHDHLIIGNNSHFSGRTLGWFKRKNR